MTTPRLVPDRPSDAHDWRCANCTTSFKATDEHWRKGFGRLAPACPYCNAYSQYTYPIGIAGKINKLERMGFQCEGGPLANCVEWQEIRRSAAPPAEAPGHAEVMHRALVRIALGESDAQKIADDAIAASRKLAAAPAAPADGDKPVMWQYRKKGSDDKWITGDGSLNADYDKDYWEVRSLYTRAPRVTGGREVEVLREALADLLSWFPDKPVPAEWRLPAGAHGADDAITAAHDALGHKTCRFCAWRGAPETAADPVREALELIGVVVRECGHMKAVDAMNDVEDAFDALTARVAANARDAARYRWLRDCENGGCVSAGVVESERPQGAVGDNGWERVKWMYDADLDAAIDAAMQEPQP